MVLSLEDICLRSVMKGVENQTIRNVHVGVPPKSRQKLLDMVLLRHKLHTLAPSTLYQRLSNVVLGRGKIDNTIWLRELTSPEFLRGVSSLDTQRENANDSDYLNLVADSFETKLENNDTIGAGIEKLTLNLHMRKNDRGQYDALNLDAVVRLIGRCSNLKSLNLITKLEGQVRRFESEPFSGLMEALRSTEQCRHVMENLHELALVSHPGAPFLFVDRPMIKFTKLTSIHLVYCVLHVTQWLELLKSVRNTLTDARLTMVDMEPKNSFAYLPMSLPHLKSFSLDTDFRCTSALVKNLKRCPKLEKVFLPLAVYFDCDFSGSWAEDEENLKALCRIEAKIDAQIRFDDNGVLDGDSKFKLVSIFNERVTELVLNVFRWDLGYTKALENVVDVCQNLTSFHFFAPSMIEKGPSSIENLSSAVVRLFSDRERASKFRQVLFFGKVDVEILTLIFENCSALEQLTICANSNYNDKHLIRWVDNGARPSQLSFHGCDQIGDEGLIPIFVNSGNRLTHFFLDKSMAKVSDRAWRVLIDHCPNLQRVGGMPDHLKEWALSKCFDLDFA